MVKIMNTLHTCLCGTELEHWTQIPGVEHFERRNGV